MHLFTKLWAPLLFMGLIQLQDSSEAQVKPQNATVHPTDTSKLSMVLNMGTHHTERQIILADGILDSQWTPRCDKQTTLGNYQPYTFDKYADEIFIEFAYENSTMLIFSKPEVRSTNGRARPEVLDFTHDEEAKSGEFSIWHNCNVASTIDVDQDSRITLTFGIWKNHSTLTLSWIKVCGNGEHQKLDFGYYSELHNPRRAKTSISLRENTENPNDLPNLGPRILSTRIYLRLLGDAYSQRFDTPLISVTEESDQADRGKKLTVELRGANHGGLIRAGTDAVFDLIYTCEGHALWRVRLEIAIVPFDDVEIELVKDCGGGRARSVSVSNDAQGQWADIVKDGYTMPSYMEQAKALPGQKKWDISTVWGRGEGSKIFFLIVDGRSEKAGEGGVGIGEIVAHSENERIGTAHIAHHDGGVYSWEGLTSIRENGESFAHLERRTLRIQVTCLRSGWMRVRVRIAVHDRKPVEWWFWNECFSKKIGSRAGSSVSAVFASMLLFTTALALMLRRNCSSPRKVLLLHSRYRGGSHISVSRHIQQPHMA